jgi:hypothetical protein
MYLKGAKLLRQSPSWFESHSLTSKASSPLVIHRSQPPPPHHPPLLPCPSSIQKAVPNLRHVLARVQSHISQAHQKLITLRSISESKQQIASSR